MTEHLIDPRSRAVLFYRWIVFLLAAGYMIYQIVISADYLFPGGPFRFLTIWALCLSFFVASRQLAFTEGRSQRVWHKTIIVTSIANALVVGLYWRLYLTDPALVTSNGPPVWHQEFYLHLIGPILQWIDALFIYGAFSRWWRAIPGLTALIAGYVLWIEGFVSRFNSFPTGSVTDGLPYPFLNSLTLDDRIAFYGTTALQALFVLMFFAVAGAGIRRAIPVRVRPQEEL